MALCQGWPWLIQPDCSFNSRTNVVSCSHQKKKKHGVDFQRKLNKKILRKCRVWICYLEIRKRRSCRMTSVLRCDERPKVNDLQLPLCIITRTNTWRCLNLLERDERFFPSGPLSWMENSGHFKSGLRVFKNVKVLVRLFYEDQWIASAASCAVATAEC